MPDYLPLNTKIYIPGHTGLVGSALVRKLLSYGYEQLILRSHKELDLTSQEKTEKFIQSVSPQVVIVPAGRVGGIQANQSAPADFLLDNLSIAQNIISSSYKHNVERIIYLGSSCVYPKDCPQPIKEEYLGTQELEFTNRSYAIAKITGIEICWALNRQYGTKYLAVMPTNLYGINDNYHLENSHVLPALIRKIHHAKINNIDSVEIWGSGKSMREFLFSDDLADAIIHICNLEDDVYSNIINKDAAPIINVGYGSDISIRDIAALIQNKIEYKGKLIFNEHKPEGVTKKLISSKKINDLGWHPSTDLSLGLDITIEDFIKNYKTYAT